MSRVRWPSRRSFIVAAFVVFAVVVVSAGTDLWLLDRRIGRLDVHLPGSAPGGTTYLIVGDDSRQHLPPGPTGVFGSLPGERADLLLVLRVPDDGSRPTILSIPRDLLVLDKDFSLQRLTLTLLAGPQRTVDALCKSLGLGIDHIVQVRFDGFTSVVDSVGGVDVRLDAPIRDTVLGLDLPAGVVHLDAPTALSYVRARHLEMFDGTQWIPVANRRGEQAREVLDQVMSRLDLSVLHPFRTQELLWRLTAAISVERGTGIFGLRRTAQALRRVSDAASVDLPLGSVSGEDDPIPFAELGAGAHAVLRQVGAGGGGCRHPALPTAAEG